MLVKVSFPQIKAFFLQAPNFFVNLKKIIIINKYIYIYIYIYYILGSICGDTNIGGFCAKNDCFY